MNIAIRKSADFKATVIKAVAIVIAVYVAAAPVLGRQNMISYEEYLRAAGVETEAESLKKLLLNQLEQESPGMTESWYHTNARFFSFILLVNGITSQIASGLQNEGIDLIHAITSDSRPLEEQSLLADLVILGEVIQFANSHEPDDGFDISVEVLVKEYLKGRHPGNSIVIRQRMDRRTADPYSSPNVGESYLFLLSGGMYGYQLVNHELRTKGEAIVSLPQADMERNFVIYRLYPYSNERLHWQNYSRRDTERAFEQVRRVDRFVHQHTQ
jgi:hypothetical protein